MIIRKATLADVEAIRNLGNVTKEFATSEGIVIFRPKEVITNCIDKDNVILLVAEEDGVIGFMLANLNHSLKKAELENLVVCEEQRHQ
ncbi:MAG: hypothetical protein LBU27_06800 [Candidatus Peribacteria bacterium]|jgi:N-acetylglutamate synthase-like GNAT family acetyltransferase|nr:hypothetical protein [Candidatus Peribacteria bacterium]